MCGRIGQYLPASWLEAFFKIDERFLENVRPNYNAAPTHNLMVVSVNPESERRAISRMKWGLIPPWSKTGKMDYSTFNAKCEGVEKAASFRAPYKSRRCIVPADLFFEWKKLDDSKKPAKQPYAVARADGDPLLLAGLWETWKPTEGEPVRSFTILTTTPNATMEFLHHRMPVILDPDDIPLWMGEVDGDLRSLMKPCPDDWLKMWKVDPRVGSVKNNDADLIKEIA